MCKEKSVLFLFFAVALIIGTTPGCLFSKGGDDEVVVSVESEDDDSDSATTDDEGEDDEGEDDEGEDDDEDDDVVDDEEEEVGGNVAFSTIALDWDVDAPETTFPLIGILATGTCESFFEEGSDAVMVAANDGSVACASGNCSGTFDAEWFVMGDPGSPLTEIEPGNYAAILLVDVDDNGWETEGLVSEQDTLLCQSILIATGTETFTVTGTGGECVMGSGCGGGGGGGASFNGGSETFVDLSATLNGNTTQFDPGSVTNDVSYIVMGFGAACGVSVPIYTMGVGHGLANEGDGLSGGGGNYTLAVSANGWAAGGQGGSVTPGSPASVVVYIKYDDPETELAPGGASFTEVADFAACFDINSFSEGEDFTNIHDSDWSFEMVQPMDGWDAVP